jgi:hypothetical protein
VTTNPDGTQAPSTSTASEPGSTTDTAAAQANGSHSQVAAGAAVANPATTTGEKHLPATLSSFDKQPKAQIPMVLVLVFIALFILAVWRSASTRAALSPEQRHNPDLD